MQNLKMIPTHQTNGLAFSTYTRDEILKMSVLEVTNPQSFDILGHPTPNGAYDPRFGPIEFRDLCATCGRQSAVCSGHFGHITLPVPVFNPIFVRITFQLMKGSCMKCHHLLIERYKTTLNLYQLKALGHGLVSLAMDMEAAVMQIVSKVDVVNSATRETIQTTLDEMLCTALKEEAGVGGEGSKERELPKTDVMVKSVVNYRNHIVNTFLQTISTSPIRCPGCKKKPRKMQLELNARIVVGASTDQRKAGGRKTKKRKARRGRKNEEEEEEEEALGLGLPSLEEENVDEQEPEDSMSKNQVYTTPLEARKHLLQVYEKDRLIIDHLFGSLVVSKDDSPISGLFLDVLPVPPTRFRPLTFRDGQKYANPHSMVLSRVVQDCIELQHIIIALQQPEKQLAENAQTILANVHGQTLVAKMQHVWFTLQVHINSIYDSNMDKMTGLQIGGVKQVLERKEGMFRMFMMGKRVNYAARSVISPDPYINVDEIGIPDVFARKLTYPQPVTPWNVKELRQAVINGPDIHPGAVMVQNENGSNVMLSQNRNQREAVAKQLLTPSLDSDIQRCKIVYRHLQNGDVLLLNRQPTLHKPSIMAHKACILPGEKTLRLNYSNCKTYNADFDGDEMNAHFPQGEVARSEAYGIASVNHQYLVPKDGTPLGGLIQDHIIAAVLLMIRGKFFGREVYQQLVFGALTNKNDCVKLLRPAIVCPRMLWSGKQVVSTVIINTIPSGRHLLSLTGKSKIPSKSWQSTPARNWVAGGTRLKGDDMTESQVVIRNGEILCGILDKAHCGPTPFGLIHCCYELYGGEVSGRLLSHLGRIFTHFLQMEGFTLGVLDILVTSKANKKRLRLMRKARNIGDAVVCDALNVAEPDADPEVLKEKMIAAHLGSNDIQMKQLDLSMKLRTDELNNQINKACIPDGLLKRFPNNNLQLMVVSGAKGSSVNCMQISCMLGQIELEGCRPRPMQSGKTLPSFVPYDSSPRAGGFVDGRFLTGIRPQEYFFHCMAGREGLIDTAVKTSRSGYLQRCLIKHLEGVGVSYDLTVRDSDGSVIQFQYGEDSLDIMKIPFLCEEQFPFLLENRKSNECNELEESLANDGDYRKVTKRNKKIRNWFRKNQKLLGKEEPGRARLRCGPFLNFSLENLPELRTTFPGVNPKTRREYAVEKLMDKWHKLDEVEKKGYETGKACPDPVTSRFRSDVTLGAISEKMDKIIESYLSEVPVTGKMARNDIRTMLHHKVMRSVCEPGEAVGLLAAQSVGEPSTQMTLNTFHFAGRGEMNVTLGIPRLREILMTASANIATPTLEIPFLTNVTNLEKKAEMLKQKLTKVLLSEVLEKVSIDESISVKSVERKRVYRIRFHLLPFKLYMEDVYLTPSKILHFMEAFFLIYLVKIAKKKINLMLQSTLVSNAAMRATQGATTTDDGDEGFPKDDDEVQLASGTQKEEDGDTSDDENEEGDAIAERNKARHNQERDYDDNELELDEEEDKLLENESEVRSDESKSLILEEEEDSRDGTELVTDVAHESSHLDTTHKPVKGTLKIEEVEVKRRIALVLSHSPLITEYKFDTETEEWCEVTIQVDLCAKRLDMVTLVGEEARKSVVHHTPGIKRAFVVEQTDANGNRQTILKTDGVNIQEIFKYDKLLDLSRLYCNDIHAMANTYGIEAAFRVIVKEVQNVFRVYGIEINPRHLLLIADYMTFEGFYRPFNRKGLENNASPLQQMSFEATTHFLKQATFLGFPDPIKSPSARLIVGKLVGCGTGSFGMMYPIA